MNNLGSFFSKNWESSFYKKTNLSEIQETANLAGSIATVLYMAPGADVDTFRSLLQVCKVVSDIAYIINEKRRHQIENIAFGKKEWLQFYQLDIGKEPLLPFNINKIIKKFFRNDFNNQVFGLIPAGLSVEKFGELSKKYFPSLNGYCRHSDSATLTELIGTNAKSYWVIMTKDIVEGSRGECFKKQIEILRKLPKHDLTEWQAPKAIEATVCILTHHARFGEYLFLYHPLTLTRCLDTFGNYHVLVGSLSRIGLYIYGYFDFKDRTAGMAGLQKFKPLFLR